MSFIVAMTFETTRPPRAATSAADEVSWFACRAESAVCLTVPVSCSNDDAACCRFEAVCSVRTERS